MRIQIKHYTIENKLITPKTFMIISDIHSQIFPEINKIILKEKVDAILIPGDIMDKDGVKDNWHNTLIWLKELSNLAPIYASLGNHEVSYADIKKLTTLLLQNNVVMLDNEGKWFDDVYLYGYTPKKINQRTVENNLPIEKNKTILLCHRPNDFYECGIIEINPFLTISGHCHGGQWRFFGRGVYAPDQGMFPKYTSGLHFDNKLLISRGLANTVKFAPRINNRPEAIILKIN